MCGSGVVTVMAIVDCGIELLIFPFCFLSEEN